MKNSAITIVCILLASLSTFSQSDNEIFQEYPEAQQEVKLVLDEIEQSIRDNDMDKLISFHAYGPKFTEFKPGEMRTGSKENEEFERGFLGSITEIEKWDLNDLKINIYGGDVAAVTFHSNFKFKAGEDPHHFQTQGMLLFIKTQNGWKITHEHLAPLTVATTRP